MEQRKIFTLFLIFICGLLIINTTNCQSDPCAPVPTEFDIRTGTPQVNNNTINPCTVDNFNTIYGSGYYKTWKVVCAQLSLQSTRGQAPWLTLWYLPSKKVNMLTTINFTWKPQAEAELKNMIDAGYCDAYIEEELISYKCYLTI